MLAPRTQIFLIRALSAATGALLLIAATGISTQFDALRFAITLGFFTLSGLTFVLGYRSLSVAVALVGLLFNPLFNVPLPRHIWVIVDIAALAGVAYFAYWATNPYWKGTRFEQYVTTLFPEPDFAIVDRTRDVSKSLNRRIESDSHPDFVFRNQKTGKSFAVECKWRGRWARGNSGELGLWWKRAQGDRYAEYAHSTGTPVFVAFGIGGSPENPREVYFLEQSRLQYAFLKQSLIRAGKAKIEPPYTG